MLLGPDLNAELQAATGETAECLLVSEGEEPLDPFQFKSVVSSPPHWASGEVGGELGSHQECWLGDTLAKAAHLNSHPQGPRLESSGAEGPGFPYRQPTDLSH